MSEDTTAVDPVFSAAEYLASLPPSPTVPHVYVALNAVQGELARIGIPKDRENKDQGFMFRSIDAVYAALTPLLVENKLLMLPRGVESDQVERATKSGTAKFCTRVTFEYDFISAVDGSMHTVRTYGEGMDMADKSTAKGQSQSYKYAAVLSFGIPLTGEPDTDEDDGGDPAIAGTAQRPTGQPPAPAPSKPETAPRFQGTRKETAKDADVTAERKAELRIIGKSFIDLVDQERTDVSVDNRYKIWELAEPLQHDELLWLSLYLDKNTRVLTRLKAVMVEERAKERARLAANDPPPVTMPADF